MNFCLIVSTFGRITELENLLESFACQTFRDFYVVIIDQNDILDISNIIDNYKYRFNLIHQKVDFKSLSKAKNYGLKNFTGDIVTFPDDDCLFYPDTLASVNTFFAKYPTTSCVYGRVYDRARKKNVMRAWSNKSYLELSKFNFDQNYSAITCFARESSLRFDENFGVGARYNSGEELDYIIRYLKLYPVAYSSSIEVWHPELNVASMSFLKMISYALGFGAVCGKHRKDFFVFFIFAKSCSYQIVLMFFSFITLNFSLSKSRFFALVYRIKGYISYH